MPTLSCSVDAVLLGINQRSSGPSTAAATDAAGTTAPPVPPGFPVADPAAANGPHAGEGTPASNDGNTCGDSRRRRHTRHASHNSDPCDSSRSALLLSLPERG